MHIESHVGTEELERRIKHAKHPKLRQRLRIVYWALQGETADQIADRVGLHDGAFRSGSRGTTRRDWKGYWTVLDGAESSPWMRIKRNN